MEITQKEFDLAVLCAQTYPGHANYSTYKTEMLLLYADNEINELNERIQDLENGLRDMLEQIKLFLEENPDAEPIDENRAYDHEEGARLEERETSDTAW